MVPIFHWSPDITKLRICQHVVYSMLHEIYIVTKRALCATKFISLLFTWYNNKSTSSHMIPKIWIKVQKTGIHQSLLGIEALITSSIKSLHLQCKRDDDDILEISRICYEAPGWSAELRRKTKCCFRNWIGFSMYKPQGQKELPFISTKKREKKKKSSVFIAGPSKNINMSTIYTFLLTAI